MASLQRSVSVFDSSSLREMSLYNYFKPINGLPDPRGPLSSEIPPEVISVINKEVVQAQKQEAATRSKKRGTYWSYSPTQRAEIGRYATLHGTTAAARYFSRKTKETISKSTVQSIKKNYSEELKKNSPVRQLPTKLRGRPLLLGSRIDGLVQSYITKVREGGGSINTRIVRAVAFALMKKYEKSKLTEFGGHVELKRSWAESLLSRMNFVSRKATTSKSKQSGRR